MLPKNSSSPVWESISHSAVEMDKNIVHSATEGFVWFCHCLSEVFLAAISASLIQILFAVEAPDILVIHLIHISKENAENPVLLPVW